MYVCEPDPYKSKNFPSSRVLVQARDFDFGEPESESGLGYYFLDEPESEFRLGSHILDEPESEYRIVFDVKSRPGSTHISSCTNIKIRFLHLICNGYKDFVRISSKYIFIAPLRNKFSKKFENRASLAGKIPLLKVLSFKSGVIFPPSWKKFDRRCEKYCREQSYKYYP